MVGTLYFLLRQNDSRDFFLIQQLKFKPMIVICLIIVNSECDSIFGTAFTGTIKRLWNGVQKVDDSHAYLIDLVQTGHSGIDSTILNTASFLKQLTTGTASELTLETYHKICKDWKTLYYYCYENNFAFQVQPT